MLKYLAPNLYLNSIHEISFEYLKEIGINGLVIDLDNTITFWNSDILSSKSIDWFEKIVESDFKVCLLSNNNKERVEKIADALNIPYIANAGKPRIKSFEKAMKIIDTECNSTAVIGDQIFTDVLGGNRLNMYTILVVPMGKKEFVGTKLVRIVERKLLKLVLPRG